MGVEKDSNPSRSLEQTRHSISYKPKRENLFHASVRINPHLLQANETSETFVTPRIAPNQNPIVLIDI